MEPNEQKTTTDDQVNQESNDQQAQDSKVNVPTSSLQESTDEKVKKVEGNQSSGAHAG